MRHKTIFTLLLLLMALAMRAQVTVQVQAPRQTEFGQRIRVSYVVNSSDVKDFNVGEFEGFRVLYGPSTSSSSSFSMINGKTTSSSTMTYTYTVVSTEEGTFKLPAATVKVGGETYKSNSPSIEVLPASDDPQGGNTQGQQGQGGGGRSQGHRDEGASNGKITGKDLYMTVTASKRKVYEQEAILLTYKLYTLVNLQQISGEMPQLDGFHVQEIDSKAQMSLKYERVDGRNYGTAVWRQYQLFPQKSEEQKLTRWKVAMDACARAIKVCDSLGFRLYDTTGIVMPYNDTLKITVALRNSLTERYNETGGNPEVIWPNTQTPRGSMIMYQRLIQPILSSYTDMLGGYRFFGVPIKIAEQFYTNHGIPIANDRNWEGVNTMELVKGDDVHAFYIQPDYTTIRLNFDREPRFYAFLGFDGGKWFGQLSNYNRAFKPTDIYDVECRMGGKHAKTSSETGPVTGYFPKKLIPIQSTWTANNTFSSYTFAWPMIRLTDLYLLYAECINEAEGPDGPHGADLFKYLDAIRSRAGIPDVKTAWEQYSNNPTYYKSQAGMRDIIHKERLNELAFESQRFWDLRRWKEATAEYQKGIYGFHVTGSAPEDYYVKTFIAEQQFGLKDYFWPIPTSYIEVNPNLVQNLGW